MASWYCAIDGQQYGPLSTDELRALAKQGQLRPADHVRLADSDQWTKAANVRGLFPATVQARTKPGPPPIAGSGAPPVARPAPPTTPLPTAIPLQSVGFDPVSQRPVVPASAPVVHVATDASATEDRGFRRERQPSAKRRNQRIIVGLSAVLLVLMVVAVLLLGRSRPATQTVADRAEEYPTATATADLETDPVSTIRDDPSGSQAAKAQARPLFPPIRRWLSAGTQKRVVGDHMRLHVVAAWWAAAGPSPDRSLVVQVEITNRSADRPLQYAGWAANAGSQHGRPAMLAFRSDEAPIAARASRDALTESAESPQVAPGQTVTRNLEFSLSPDVEAEYFRLMLPYEAWGLSGQVGFEIPEVMVLDGPPDMAWVPDPDPATATVDEDQGRATELDAAAREPETIMDLKAQIEASVAETADQSAEQEPQD